MPRHLRRSVTRSLVVATLVVTALAATGQPATPAATPPARHVVLIGLDGFDPSYLAMAPTPNLDLLASRGVHGVTQGVMLPITTPSFTSIATGTWPDQHGTITYYFDRATNTFHTNSPPSQRPSIANAVIDSGGTVGAAQYWAFNGHGAAYGNPDGLYTQPGGACSNMFDDAIAMLRQEPVSSSGTMVTVPQIPTLLGVYCSHLDTIGHDEGAESPNLATALADIDLQVGRLMATLDDLGIGDETTVIITGDHGMSTYTQRNTIPLNQALADAGYRPQMLLVNGQSVDPNANVLVVPGAGRATSLYLVGDLEGDGDALADVESIALGVEGIERAFDRNEQAAMHMNPKFGDLVVESAPGWSTGVLPMSGPRGDHGSTEELDAGFFMAGAGVAPRSTPVRVCHVNVAPTIAHLLGLPPLPGADGGPITGDYDNLLGCPLSIPNDTPPDTTTSTTTTTTTTSTTTTTLPPGSTTSTTQPEDSTSTTSTTLPQGSTTLPPDSTTTTTAPSSTPSTLPATSTSTTSTSGPAGPVPPTPAGADRPATPATPVRSRPSYAG